MFGPGLRRIVPKEIFLDRRDIQQFEPISTIDGIPVSPTGEVLNLEFLSVYSTALCVAKDYFNYYYVHCADFNDPIRSKKDVSLTAINADSSKEDTVLQKQLFRCESTNSTFLLQPHIFTVKKLDKEVDDLILLLRNNDILIHYTSSLTKQSSN